MGGQADELIFLTYLRPGGGALTSFLQDTQVIACKKQSPPGHTQPEKSDATASFLLFLACLLT